MLPLAGERLDAWSVTAEGRYALRPFYLAARGDYLGFNRVRVGDITPTWDAPVWRAEAGVGYSPVRHLTVKAAYQYNWRHGGAVRREGLAAGQMLLWF